VPPGERCAKLYVTNLSNLAQPLIRYELTDELRILDEPCPCGSAFRRVNDIEGRSDDLFTYPGGVVVHPLVFRSPLGREGHVVEYQVHQTPRGAAIQLRAEGEVDVAALSQRIAEALARSGVKEPQVTVARVEAFERQVTGKLKRFFPMAAQEPVPQDRGGPSLGLRCPSPPIHHTPPYLWASPQRPRGETAQSPRRSPPPRPPRFAI